jgi:hypothetical protein
MLEVLHELVDAVHSLKAITANRRGELHAILDKAEAGARAETDAGKAAAGDGVKPGQPESHLQAGDVTEGV